MTNMSGHFAGYVISQFVNLTIYYFLIQNTKAPLFLIFLTYMFSLIVFYMFYTLIFLQMIVIEGYWKGYFITLAIQAVISIVLAMIDSKTIKRGRDE